MLGRREHRAALDFLAYLGEASDLDDFAQRLVRALDEVIRCDGCSYNEIDLVRQRARWVSGIPTRADFTAAFEHHMPDHPMLNHVARRPGAGAFTVSDLLSQRQWRDLGVYRDLYRPLGLEHILAVEVSGGTVSVDVAAFRAGGDFAERDRTMLNLLRPHLVNGWRSAAALTDLGERLSLVQSGLEAGGLGMIVMRDADRATSVSDIAHALLSAYFGRAAGSGDNLPPEVLRWLQCQGPGGGAPLVLDRGDRRLAVQLVRHRGRRLVLLRERRMGVQPRDLAVLGLTGRESEVLAWVAGGKTDAEIATILAISPRTVSHTLERVYRKLGVATRTGAAAAALAAVDEGAVR